ncbi:efflux RND transporter periplasmic adaptor subunit [Corallincola platygyrae]|uniref:Efflux RND transporter periplasmic adaptor subunit n=1 Tax=Corallincola platygyrae TaxID=1193278 RepID=A0ABW4XKZ0_9GAMM
MIKDTSAQDTVVSPSVSKRFKQPLLWGVFALGLGVLLWGTVTASTANHSIARADLRFATLTKGDLIRDIATSGKIVAANAPVLYSLDKGTVTLLAKPGDEVAKGDIVAEIESPTLLNNLKQQQALLEGMKSSLQRAHLNARRDLIKAEQTIDMAKVDLDAAARESRRGHQLIADKLISQIDFEKNEDDLKKAKMLYGHAKQEAGLMKDTLAFELQNLEAEVNRQVLVVEELKRQVEALAIKAPVAGIIGNWLVEQKARIEANAAILTVVDLTAFEAELMVPESYADDLGLGMEVELSFGAIKVMGQLSSISPEVRNREVTARVRFAQQSGLKLRQNQWLSARVLLENRKDVLMVKRGAFVTSGGGREVYVVEGEQAVKKSIRLGARSSSHVEVISGGKPGDVWVISSIHDLNGAEQVLIN